VDGNLWIVGSLSVSLATSLRSVKDLEVPILRKVGSSPLALEGDGVLMLRSARGESNDVRSPGVFGGLSVGGSLR